MEIEYCNKDFTSRDSTRENITVFTIKIQTFKSIGHSEKFKNLK